MPTAVKRRKLGVNTKPATSSRALDAFTRVSKANAITTTKTVEQKATIAISEFVSAAASKKRKFIEEDDENTVPSAAPIIEFLPQLPVPQTPQKPILSQTPSSAETPTKGARSLLDRFCIAKTPTRSPVGWNSSSSEIIGSTPKKPYIEPTQLPAELQDLINLHAAFLTALSIQYAHNGTSSPADLRNLYPNVARAWGKRSVTIDDICRTLGVMNAEGKNSQLSLADYGRGKICIELASSSGRILRPINEDVLNTAFVIGLTRRWEERENIEMEVIEFIASLPLEQIGIADCLTKVSPMLAKGQRRLEELKKGVTVTKSEVVKEVTKPDGTKMTLLERLRAKQLQQSKLPPPPSKEQLARKAALGKIEEVASVLGVLSTSSSIGQQRISFTMSTVLEKLKDSLKTPISKAEGSICIRLLAEEIASDWVKIMKMGKSEMIVVDRDQRLGELDIRKRVKSASLK